MHSGNQSDSSTSIVTSELDDKVFPLHLSSCFWRRRLRGEENLVVHSGMATPRVPSFGEYTLAASAASCQAAVHQRLNLDG